MSPLSLPLVCLLIACAGAAFGPAGSRGRHRGLFRMLKLQNYPDNYDEDKSFTSSDCRTLFMGRMTNYDTELDIIRIRVPRSLVDLPNVDEDIAGQEVTVCNRDRTGAPTILPPTEGFSPIAVISSELLKWPEANLVMKVIQYMEAPVYNDLKK